MKVIFFVNMSFCKTNEQKIARVKGRERERKKERIERKSLDVTLQYKLKLNQNI